jgi:hypothetical protein
MDHDEINDRRQWWNDQTENARDWNEFDREQAAKVAAVTQAEIDSSNERFEAGKTYEEIHGHDQFGRVEADE